MREKGGNGARYGEMARKPGIVTGNGRRSTPLTERKLESEEIVGGQPLPPRDLCTNRTAAVHGRRTKEETNWDILRTRIAEGTKGGPVNAKKKIVGLSLFDWSLSLPFFPFLRYLNCARKPFAGLN